VIVSGRSILVPFFLSFEFTCPWANQVASQPVSARQARSEAQEPFSMFPITKPLTKWGSLDSTSYGSVAKVRGWIRAEQEENPESGENSKQREASE
jgi:hypothetical protein